MKRRNMLKVIFSVNFALMEVRTIGMSNVHTLDFCCGDTYGFGPVFVVCQPYAIPRSPYGHTALLKCSGGNSADLIQSIQS